MKTFTPLFWLLCIQVLLPCMLFSQKALTKEIPTAFDSLIQVSRDYTAEAEFELAFTASAAAGDLAVACCGEYSEVFASYCFNEGRIRDFMGRKEEAIEWYTRSKELRADLLGTSHPDYGKSLNNLATVYDELGRPRLAEPLYLEALEVRRTNDGEESLPYANVLDNLAILYQEMGRFEEAELLGFQVKDIRERLLGKDDPEYGKSLINLATLYFQTNNFQKAKQLFLEAKVIYEAQEYLDFYAYMAIIDNLGATCQGLGDFENAAQYYRDAEELRRQVLGTENIDYALSLNHLAGVFTNKGILDSAEVLLNRTLAILASINQEKDITYGFALQDLGAVYFQREQYQEARQFELQALAILETHLSRNHYRCLQSYRDLATIEILEGNYESAATYLRELAYLEQKPFNSAVRYLSEEELANYTQDFERNLYSYLTLAEEFPGVADLCYNKLLLYKGFLQNKALQLQQFAQQDSLTRGQYQEFRNIHRHLGAQYSSSFANEDEIRTLEEEAYQLEKNMVRNRAEIDNVLQTITWQQVRDGLEENATAIEFVHYQNKHQKGEKGDQYAALLVLPQAKQPIFVPLFFEAELAEHLRRGNQSISAFINALYQKEGTGETLYKMVWANIEETLRKHPEINTVYYSASGLLHRLNIAAIPVPTGKTLGQQYELFSLGSTRDLALTEAPPATSTNNRAVLYGSIDYGKPEQGYKNSSEEINTGIRALITNSNYQPRGYLEENGYWQELPWTEVEIMTAQGLFAEHAYQPVLKTGTQATEASLKSLGQEAPSPAVLHLATHGFFFPDSDETKGESDLAFRASERSMIRSGLVLADGNFAWANGRPREAGAEDGILTAYEVSKMDLSETELVVLSACETGLGDIKGTEGVYGLQRAFKIAGARYLIMTLWQVPDFQAQAFMTTFYLAWLEEGKTIPEAFRAAQFYMRARYKDAFDWAGFVLVK